MSATEKKEVVINFAQVKAGVKNVRVNGLKKTRDEYLKKHFGNIFEAGNFDEILHRTDQIRQNLSRLGCFSKVETLIDVARDEIGNSSKKLYDIIIDVEELNSIGGGIHSSFGNNEGSLSSSVYFPNMFGAGEKLSAEYTYGTRNHVDYRLNFSSPIDLNPSKQFNFSVFRSLNEFSWSKYKETHKGISIDILRPFSYTIKNKYELKGTHLFTYEGIWRHLISDLDASFSVREESGHSLKSSLKYTNIIDRRDSGALPTRGGLLKTSVEVAGLGGDVRFSRLSLDYQVTRTFLKYFTTQLSFSNGVMTPLRRGEKISINDRFFLGGPLSLRGFNSRGAGPHTYDCSLGNDAYWLFGAHLYTPLPFFHKNKSLSSWLKTHSFVNMGNLLSFSHFRSLDEHRIEYLLTNSRLSVGSGIVLAFGNVARLELNYVWPIWKNSRDKASEGIQFGIGVNFN